MKILYIHQYFKTPSQPGGTRSYWISQELIKNGHQVTMIGSNRVMEAPVERKLIDGIEVIYVNVRYDSGSMSIPARLWAFLKFVFKSIPVAFKEKDVDLVVATSTPLTVGIPALLLKWFKGIPFVFEVRDLWPEVPIQMGGLKNPIAIKLALWLEKTIYKNAKHIVALSPGMYDGVVERKIPQEKVSMIPNMSKIDEFWVREKDVSLIKKLGLKEDSFKVIYFGAMGIANGMEYIIDAAKLLSNEKDIEILFLGAGASQEILVERIEKESITNAKYLGLFSMQELSEIVNLCDVSLVSFLDLPILATNSPNKLFDSLSAGKPVIVNSRGWTKTMVKEHDCGFFVDPQHPQELADKIIYLKENPQICKRMGENSRKLAETVYDKSILCREFVDVIESLKL